MTIFNNNLLASGGLVPPRLYTKALPLDPAEGLEAEPWLLPPDSLLDPMLN